MIDQICGRDVTEIKRSHKGKSISSRYQVSGINHPNGRLPIKFKSVERAERHIRNMRLEK